MWGGSYIPANPRNGGEGREKQSGQSVLHTCNCAQQLLLPIKGRGEGERGKRRGGERGEEV